FPLFFFLDKKETKNQGCKISTHRHRGIVRSQSSRAAPKYRFILKIDYLLRILSQGQQLFINFEYKFLILI
ncbi:MAG: hypothetical protein ACXVPU_08760, partial [Bacteroidia bacterium]